VRPLHETSGKRKMR